MEEKPVYLERTRSKLENARTVQEKFEMRLCNRDFAIYPNVFNPNIFFGTEFLAEELMKVIAEFQEKRPAVLEIGTGAGYMVILAILNGASDATCTDINRDAVKNAEENIVKYNMQDRITVKHSDVYGALNSDDKFDIIIWNYPFGHVNKPVEELTMLERALIDPHYRSLDEYLRMADEYLNPAGGRLLIGFSTASGDLQAFESIAKKYSWIIHRRNETKADTVPMMQMGLYELTKHR